MRKVTYIRPPKNLSSELRGFYERVASRLGVDSSYVNEVALGERRSELVEEGIRNELTSILQQGTKTASRHEAHFYSHDAVLVNRLVPFFAAALKSGDPSVIIATKLHLASVMQRLRSDGVDMDSAMRAGMYVPLDANGTLSIFMINGMPEPSRFFRIVGGLLEESAKIAKRENPRIAAFGEWVSILCSNGQVGAAIRLEQLWNQLAAAHEIDLLCGYKISDVRCEENSHDFKSLCAEHSAVYAEVNREGI